MFVPNTNMESRQPQHLENVNSQFLDDCSSEEKTLFQYISHYPEILGLSLVQRQLCKQQ